MAHATLTSVDFPLNRDIRDTESVKVYFYADGTFISRKLEHSELMYIFIFKRRKDIELVVVLFQASCNTERTGVRVITLCPGLTETALTIDSPNKLLSRVMKADFVKNLEQLTIQT
jgi:hypothetical protein